LSLRQRRTTRRACNASRKRRPQLAKSLGGVMSGEHGDGRARGPFVEAYFYGKELMDAFRAVKGVFDPQNLMNPGNVVEPGPMSSISEQHARAA
jgi:FAD/FMN-containing dehydrogenase